MQRLSGWIVVYDFCAMRIIEGSDPNDIANRVAFIEKTPRIRVNPFTTDGDHKNWRSGLKGIGCSAGEEKASGAYGYDIRSRIWCDMELIKLGYHILDTDPWLAYSEAGGLENSRVFGITRLVDKSQKLVIATIPNTVALDAVDIKTDDLAHAHLHLAQVSAEYLNILEYEKKYL